ncbi:MAG: 5-formyltetrahydrofolate cyclo-ligase [Prevotella sp.]|nr:5-formyltetrahydrofolate cyclo-ligase [Prevotella sp.]
MTDKQEIRKMLRQQQVRHTVAEAFSIISRLKAHPVLAHARTLLLYHAMADEVPTQELLQELISEGKTVLLPRVVNDEEMEIRHYTGPEDLQVGAFGIMEPTGALFTDYDRIDLAIIPGIAFDREGHRLGRGKGYYDRFLSRILNTYKIGICFPERLLEQIPTAEHDISVDEVIC